MVLLLLQNMKFLLHETSIFPLFAILLATMTGCQTTPASHPTDEPFRSVYHHSPLAGWMNAPNGMFYDPVFAQDGRTARAGAGGIRAAIAYYPAKRRQDHRARYRSRQTVFEPELRHGLGAHPLAPARMEP